MDPSTVLAVADGAKKLASTPFAVAQGIFGFLKSKKYEKQLQGMVDNYKPNQSIMDYYNKALTKYNANPYQSAMYNQQQKMAGRNLATGISSLQGRRSALAGIGSLVQGANDASLRAAAGAEQDQAQDLSQLGQATGMKAGEDKYKFENKYNLLAMKAGAANSMMNTGIKNLMG